MVGGRTDINRTMEGICEGLAGLLRQAGHMIAELGEGTPPAVSLCILPVSPASLKCRMSHMQKQVAGHLKISHLKLLV